MKVAVSSLLTDVVSNSTSYSGARVVTTTPADIGRADDDLDDVIQIDTHVPEQRGDVRHHLLGLSGHVTDTARLAPLKVLIVLTAITAWQTS
jgi:hypothetical protein